MVKEILQSLGAQIIGEGTKLFYLVELDPKKITLLEKNANKMDRMNYKRLVDNIKEDGELSSIPLCYVKEKDLIVISGNHRVMASIDASCEKILVMVFKETPHKDILLRLQLGHNIIHGKDDRQILEEIIKEFDDLRHCELSGFSSDYLESLPEIEKINIGSIDIELNEVVLYFHNLELSRLKQLASDYENVIFADVTSQEMREIRTFSKSVFNVYNLSQCFLSALKMARKFDLEDESLFEEGEVPFRIGLKWGIVSRGVEKKFKKVLAGEYGNDLNSLLEDFLKFIEKSKNAR